MNHPVISLFVSIGFTSRQSLYHQRRLTGILGINQKSTYIFRTFRTQSMFSNTVGALSSLGSISSMLCERCSQKWPPGQQLIEIIHCLYPDVLQYSTATTVRLLSLNSRVDITTPGKGWGGQVHFQKLYSNFICSRSGVAVSSKNGMVIKSCV